jgi:hypothetical protein
MVNLFTLGGAIIPEPTSFGLVMIGLGGLFLKPRSRGRRLAA